MTASISQATNQWYLMKDYYHKDIEKPGVWAGSGAKSLDLEGEIDAETMGHLWKGYAQDGSTKLVQNAGAKNRQAAWDITFSAPKSYSVAWAVADDDLRVKLEEAHHQAVWDAFAYLEDNAAYSRRGAGGSERDKAGLVVGLFQHGTSREQDPQLHTHGLVFNTGVRDDGSTGTVESRPFYQAKMAAGATYRATLATESQRLGFEIEHTEKGGFELQGVPKEARDFFSTRSQQIGGYLEEHGLEGTAANKARATLETRAAKKRVEDRQLRETWRDDAKDFGVTPESIRGLQKEGRELTELEMARNRKRSLEEALDSCLTHDSVFSERTLDRALAEKSLGKELTYADIKAVKEKFLASRDAVELDSEGKGRLFTTMQQLDTEAELHDCTMSRAADKSHHVNSKHVFEALGERPTMSMEQRRALVHVTNAGGVKVVSGMAGTGKSYVLGAAKEVWEKNGYQIQGLSLSGKAADGLQQSSGIESRTLDSYFASLDYQREQGNEKVISAKTVLVVDEAGMVDTKRMTRLVQEADDGGAKVVLVGDGRQLQSVESGGSFQTIARQVGEAELREIRRQENEVDQQVVHDFADGNAKKALDSLDERGFFSVETDKRKLRERLIQDWGGVEKPQDHLILASTNQEVKALNQLAQEKRKAAGVLGEKVAYVAGETFFKGDRILFRRNDSNLNVKNGSMGQITSISHLKKQFNVRLDNNQQVVFSHQDYSDISLGYAATVHKAQGMTVQNAYVMTGGKWDRHLSYVAASRAKEETRIYAEGNPFDKEQTKAKLAREMNQDKQKQLASDRIPELRRSREPMRVGQDVGFSR